MMVHGMVWVAMAGLLAVGCKGDSGISYSQDVAPILEQRCNVCHHPTSKLGIDFANPFDSEVGIVGQPNTWFDHDPASNYEFIVDPHTPENSAIVAKVRDLDLDPDSDGNTMPYLLEPLTEAELESVEAWIAAGANDDETFAAVATIFGTQIAFAPDKGAGRCTFCHYPDAPNGLNVLDVFDPVEGMVGVESSFGGLIVDPGNPDESVLMRRLRGEGVAQMPLQLPRLEDAEVQKIVEWIIAGAPNN